MRAADFVPLLLFLSHLRWEVGASEISEKVEFSEVAADRVKEKDALEDDFEEEEDEFVGDESDNEREGGDFAYDDQEIGDEEEEEVEEHVEGREDVKGRENFEEGQDIEGREGVEGGEAGEEVTLESVRLGWDLFKEWQEVRKSNLCMKLGEVVQDHLGLVFMFLLVLACVLNSV